METRYEEEEKLRKEVENSMRQVAEELANVKLTQSDLTEEKQQLLQQIEGMQQEREVGESCHYWEQVGTMGSALWDHLGLKFTSQR